MKRKRGGSSPISSPLDQPPLKKSTETMSHVEIPTADISRPTPTAQGKGVPLYQLPENLGLEGLARTSQVDSQKAGWNGRSPDFLLPSNTMANVADNQRSDGRAQKLKSDVSLTLLRQTVESQFNLEILLKHRELRLIDQELAKCQVALEQLRRCQIIPYPTQSSTVEGMQAVIGGSGPVYNKHAPHAPPWGIPEGPYTRHYERWLIPDSAFDDNVTENVGTPSTAGKMLPDRPTRSVKAHQGIAASQSRSQRGSTGAQLDALPHAYRESKQERGPMIVKRPSDGHMVKLVCLDCRRSNFNSVQGFINHCRIQHARQFASHSTAIEASGEELDAESEGGGSADVNTSSEGAASAGLVHPLIRSARPPALEPTTPLPKRKKATSTHMQPSRNGPDRLAMSTPRQHQSDELDRNATPSAPFKPSPQTPHLSALLAKMGRGGDLDDMVTDAKIKPEVGLAQQDDDDDEDSDVDELEEPDPRSRSTRGVIRDGDRPASSNKSKPIPENFSKIEAQAGASHAPRRVPASVMTPAYPSPYGTETHLHDDQDNSTTCGSTPFNLSPNTTDPHPAPSLVSDDDEYDITHSESEATSNVDEEEEDDHYIQGDLLDHDHLELGESSSLNLAHPGKAHGSATGRRSRPSTVIHDGHEERHVSFASPVGRQGKGSKAPADGN
ncbi:MAG: hypothetical protein Q9217_006680 [Psora testacea]